MVVLADHWSLAPATCPAGTAEATLYSRPGGTWRRPFDDSEDVDE